MVPDFKRLVDYFCLVHSGLDLAGVGGGGATEVSKQPLPSSLRCRSSLCEWRLHFHICGFPAGHRQGLSTSCRGQDA